MHARNTRPNSPSSVCSYAVERLAAYAPCRRVGSIDVSTAPHQPVIQVLSCEILRDCKHPRQPHPRTNAMHIAVPHIRSQCRNKNHPSSMRRVEAGACSPPPIRPTHQHFPTHHPHTRTISTRPIDDIAACSQRYTAIAAVPRNQMARPMHHNRLVLIKNGTANALHAHTHTIHAYKHTHARTHARTYQAHSQRVTPRWPSLASPSATTFSPRGIHSP